MEKSLFLSHWRGELWEARETGLHFQNISDRQDCSLGAGGTTKQLTLAQDQSTGVTSWIEIVNQEKMAKEILEKSDMSQSKCLKKITYQEESTAGIKTTDFYRTATDPSADHSRSQGLACDRWVSGRKEEHTAIISGLLT